MTGFAVDEVDQASEAASRPVAVAASSPSPTTRPTTQRPGRMQAGIATDDDPEPDVSTPDAKGSLVPRPSRIGPVQLRSNADHVAASGFVPHAVSPETWSTVSERRRAEVLERAALLNVRNHLPDDAVSKALASVIDDEEEVENPFDWGVARRVIASFPPPFRDVDHRPSPAMLELAAVVERLCEAELSEPGSADDMRDYFAGFGLRPATLDALAAAFVERLARLRAETRGPLPIDAAAEPARGSLPEPYRGPMFGMNDEYDGLTF